MTPNVPAWARMGAARREHVARVVALLESWASRMGVSEAEARAWRDAGAWHDCLRDAADGELRALARDEVRPAVVLHGPAAAERLAQEGETRAEVLDAVRWHTVGHAAWARTGCALFMADYLEPGRPFSRAERAFLAAVVPVDFGGAFRQVVRLRLEGALRDAREIFPETLELWNRVR